MRVMMYLFFILSTVALLPSWAFAATTWRLRRGAWVWVNPSEYARCAFIANDWVLVVVNNILWAGILTIGFTINYFLKG